MTTKQHKSEPLAMLSNYCDSVSLAKDAMSVVLWLNDWWSNGGMAISPSTLYSDDKTIEAEVENIARRIMK